MRGDERVVRLLVNAGAAVDALGGECGTPLQAAAAGGHGGVVEPLLKAGANANIKHLFRLPPNAWRGNMNRLEAGVLCEAALQAACVKGDKKTVRLLVNAGAAVDAVGGECGTPFQAAVAGGHGGVVELLLQAGVDTNVKRPFYFSAARHKVRLGYRSHHCK